MNYSPLAIHCTSLCFDVIQTEQFKTLTHSEIDGFREDVYELVKERSLLCPSQYGREHLFISHVTEGIIVVLKQCQRSRSARDATWILSALESRIEISIKTIFY